MALLAKPLPRLLCSLVHTFGRRDVDDFEAFIKEACIRAVHEDEMGQLQSEGGKHPAQY